MTEAPRMALPADGHVHSECSWDAPYASMDRACRRAVELGLPSIAFTDHADLTPRSLAAAVDPPGWQRHLVTGGVLVPPAFDVDGYLLTLNDCRLRYPGLRILASVELGEPHWHEGRAREVLGSGRFERVLASVHALPASAGYVTVDAVYGTLPPERVMRMYLREVWNMVERFDQFDALAHIDYAARYWPHDERAYWPADFEDDYRAVLSVLAAKGKALEVNTRVPLAGDVLRWWRDEKGEAITFGSDAHRPDDVARGFADVAALAEASGFAPGRGLHDLWTRR